MKIVYLTAGAAGMFCGSCLHDNAVAKSLIARGHDCLLVPVYTPIRTDDEDVSVDRVFMGGINVYLQQKLPWLSYLPNWVDGFLNQPWIINPLTKNAGKTSPKLLGALAVSMLQGTRGRQKKEFSRLLDWISNDIRPDAIVLTNLLIGGGIPDLRRRTSSRVYVTLQGDDIFLDSLPEKYRTRAIELMKGLVPQVDAFLVHSKDYAARMGQLLQIPEAKLLVVPLGIDVSDFRTKEKQDRPRNDRSFVIGYFARMAPEKGLHRIVDAFIALAKEPNFEHVRLKMAGWMGPQHTEYWALQQSKLSEAGLSHRAEYSGIIDRREKARFLRSIDLFCVPTTYEEPKGLFLLEAVAAGVPYLQPDHGAFPEIHARLRSHGETGVSDLFRADSQQDLNQKLRQIVSRAESHQPNSESLLNEIDIERHTERLELILQNAIGSGVTS